MKGLPLWLGKRALTDPNESFEAGCMSVYCGAHSRHFGLKQGFSGNHLRVNNL